MATSSSKPRPSAKQIEKSLEDRAAKLQAAIPCVGIDVPDFVSQAEIVYVLTLRAQLSILAEKLLRAQENIRHKLEEGAEEEYGYYSCRNEHTQLKIWESDSLLGL